MGHQQLQFEQLPVETMGHQQLQFEQLPVETMGHQQLQFEQLPVELKMNVFSYFTQQELSTRISPVCNMWHQLAHASSFWKTISVNDTSFWKRSVPVITAYLQLLNQHPFVHQLKIAIHTSAQDLLICFPALPKLSILELYCLEGRETLYDDGWKYLNLSHVVKQCPQIQEIVLKAKNLTLKNVFTIMSLKHLTKISIYAPYKNKLLESADSFMNLIVNECHELKRINVYFGFDNLLTDNSILNLVEKHKKSLTHINIRSYDITNRSLYYISECDKLEGLDIRDSNVTQYRVLSSLCHLKSLSIRLNLSINEEIESNYELEILFSSLSKLVYVRLGCVNISERILSTIANTCTLLKTLFISAWCQKTDKMYTPLLTCHSLKHLKLEHCVLSTFLIYEFKQKLTNLILFEANGKYHINYYKLSSTGVWSSWFDLEKIII